MHAWPKISRGILEKNFFSDMSIVNHGVGAEGLLAAQSVLGGKIARTVKSINRAFLTCFYKVNIFFWLQY
jgi:hypothetical protein